MSFIVNPTSISETQIFNDLKTFVDTKPDAAKWQNFFNSAVGTTILKIMAGLSAYYSYNNIVGRREAYLPYAQNRSSIIGGAQQLGYSAFRGRNALLTLTVTPNFSGSINRFDVIGQVNSQSIVALETKAVNSGESTTIQCVVGNTESEELVANSNDPSLFRFTGNGTISDTLRVLVDDAEVEISERVLDITNFKYIVQTNSVGSVDVFSDNSLNLPIRYDTGSIVTLEWVTLKDEEFTTADVQFNLGTLTNVNIDNVYTAPESDEVIRINAPLQNETQFVIRAREDQPKQFRQLDTSIIDATAEDVSAAVMRIYYLRSDFLLFSNDEKDDLVEAFEQFRPHGLLPPLIGDPTEQPITIAVDATLQDNTGDPVADITALIAAYEGALNQTVVLDDLERDIENLSNIKIARPTFSGPVRVNGGKYQVGQIYKLDPDNGRIYQVKEIIYQSDSVEPTWPDTQSGETVIDNELVWTSIANENPSGIFTWQADTTYRIGDLVRPSIDNGFVYEVTANRNFSDSSEPSWPFLGGENAIQKTGERVADGDILWIARPQEGSPVVWTANTRYELGDTVIATDQTASDTEGLMFQAFAFLGTAALSEPALSSTLGAQATDGNFIVETQDPLQATLESGIDGYFKITKSITVS